MAIALGSNGNASELSPAVRYVDSGKQDEPYRLLSLDRNNDDLQLVGFTQRP